MRPAPGLAAAARGCILVLAAFLPFFLLEACFTDVGNAENENKIQADFTIDYTRSPALPKLSGVATLDTAVIGQFYLLVREAEYHLKGGGERHLWRESDSGRPVDFTGRDSLAVLPVQSIESDSILDFSLECQLPSQRILDPGSVAFSTFRDKGYIKGIYAVGGDSIPFLFALPAGKKLRVHYQAGMLEDWKIGGAYDIQVIFFGLKWLSGAGIDQAVRSKDSEGRKMILLDAGHNASLHQALVARFLASFNTRDVFLE